MELYGCFKLLQFLIFFIRRIIMFKSKRNYFLILLFFTSFLAFSTSDAVDDTIQAPLFSSQPSDKNESNTFSHEDTKLEEIGYVAFLSECLGKEISVTIKEVDNTIVGKLKTIYQDGILIKTSFKNNIFILKDSIAYIKISQSNIEK